MPNAIPITAAAPELRKLTEAALAVIHGDSVEDVVHLTVDRAAVLLSVDRVILCLADEHGLLSIAGAHGIDGDVCSRLRAMPPHQAVQRIEHALEVSSKQLVAVPLTIESRVGGVLAAVVAEGAHHASVHHEWLLAALGDHAAVAIANRRRRELEQPAHRAGRALESCGIGRWEYVPASGRLFWDARCRALFNAGRDLPDRYDAFLAAVHADDRPQLHEQIQRTLGGSTDSFCIDCRPGCTGASERWLMAAGSVSLDDRGEPTGIVGALIDVTERRKREVELEAAIRSKEQFLMTLSHDLRTPLTAIGGWVRLLQLAKLSPEQAARALDVIGRNVKTQTRIVDDLLDVSRMATGAMRVHPIWCDAAAVIESAADGVRPAAQAKEIRIDMTVEPDGVRLFADPQRLEQLLFHLLSNAVKFTGRCGQIAVTGRRAGAEMEIAVTDNGEGIAPQLIPHLLDGSLSADQSAARERGGQGLGLSIVRHVVALHGGSASVHSDGKGMGTTLIVRLPLPPAAEVEGVQPGRFLHHAT